MNPCPTPLTPVKQTPEGYRSGQRWCTRRGRATFFWPAVRIGIIHNRRNVFQHLCFCNIENSFLFFLSQTFLMKFRTGRCWNLIKVDYIYPHVFGGFKPPTERWIRTPGRALLDRLLDVHRTNGKKNLSECGLLVCCYEWYVMSLCCLVKLWSQLWWFYQCLYNIP